MAFYRDLGRFGTRTALIDPDGGAVAYAALAARVDHWRATLAGHTSGPGDRLLIGLELAPVTDLIAAYLAALRDGHPVILAGPGGFSETTEIRRLYRPNLIITRSGDRAMLTPADPDPCPAHADLRLLLSTSGSTGAPKLVRLSDENITANAAAIARSLGLTAGDVGVTSLPLHYAYGLSVLHSHLEAGAALALTDLPVADPDFAGLVARAQVTNLAFVPHQIDLLLAAGRDPRLAPSVRLVTQAGGRLDPGTVARLAGAGARQGWDFIVMYGQTEAAPRMACLAPAEALANPDCIGQPLPGGRFRLLRPDGSPITGAGEAGELVYQGPNVMLGYAEARADLARGREVDQLRTGDIAERNAAGHYRITGRSTRFVKLYGLRINLDRIERMIAAAGLNGHAVGVLDRLVVMTDRPGDRARIATLVATECGLPATDILVAAMPDIPHLSSGKPDLPLIAARAAGAVTAARSAPRRQSLAADFAGATRAPQVAPSDTFARLGGDSLAYLHVMLAIEDRLGRVPPDWEHLSVARLDQMAATPAPPRAPLDPAAVARLIAMTSVVIFHLTFWPIYGGTWVLVLLMGHSFGRFQTAPLLRGHFGTVARHLFWPVLPLYFAVLFATGLLGGHVPRDLFLLTANRTHDWPATLLSPYWFISLYAQLAVCLLAFGCSPWARRRIATDAFAFAVTAALAAIAVAALIRLTEPGCGPTACLTPAHRPLLLERTLPFCLPLPLIGWAMQAARSGRQKALALLALTLALNIFPVAGPAFSLMMIATAALLLWPRPLSVPPAVARLIHRLGTATFFVFLLHTLVIWGFRYATPALFLFGPVLSSLIALPFCFALGLAAEAAFRRLERQTLSLIARRPKARDRAPA